MHILYIDDDQIDRLAFQRMLRQLPAFSCDCVSSIKQGQERLAEHSYDLVVSDHHLSDGTAFDLLAQKSGPVMVTSGIDASDAAARFKEAGALAFLLKPISAFDFKEAVQALFTSPSHSSDTGFDLTYLHELAGGDPEFEQEMIAIYLQEVPQAIANIQQSLDEGNSMQLTHHVHKVRSKIRILGLAAAMSLSSEVEKSLKKGETDDFVLQKAQQLVQILEGSLSAAQQLLLSSASN